MPELYEFQKQAVQGLQAPEKHAVIASTGCFAGDTKIRTNSGGVGRQTKLKTFYLSWHGLNPHSQTAMKNNEAVYIRGWRNGRVGLNKVKDVLCLGRKQIIRLEFTDGTIIRCTHDHKFMGYATRSHNHAEPDWIEAKDLLGCFVAKDNPHPKRGKPNKKMHDKTFIVPDSHPFARTVHARARGQTYKTIEFHRAVYEAKLNGFDDVYDWRDNIGFIDMQFVNPKEYHIHHIDHNHYNNEPSNLQAVPVLEHLRHHSNRENFHQGEVSYIECVEIEECGEETVYDVVCEDVHSYTANDFVVHNCGKTAVSLKWAETTPNKKWLVVTTASARDSNQWFNEMSMWCEESLSSISLTVISWEALAKWTIANWNSLDNYTFIFDELAKAKAGVSSARGRAFLQIAKRTDWWAGFTATPGDRWIDFQAYFIAGGYIKNKTQFQREFCQIQTFKGYPEIVGYHDTETLKRWWDRMTVVPDTTQMLKELPKERHFTYEFKPDPHYFKLLKTRETKDGVFLDTSGAFCAECRRLCFGKQKQQWLADYLEGLDTNTVIFYALTETGDRICELAKKALPKDAKVWRIYGKTHEIPTKETIGKRDVVVCQWQAGSEALNLQFMHEWVSAEPCYSYSTSQQARGRIKRIGQESNMTFRYLMCPNTIEESIYQALKEKGEFSAEVWYQALKKGD